MSAQDGADDQAEERRLGLLGRRYTIAGRQAEVRLPRVRPAREAYLPTILPGQSTSHGSRVRPAATPTNNILIIGATSAIATHTARLWTARGARLFLATRNPEGLAATARDLVTRGGEVRTHIFEAMDARGHAALIDAAFAWLGSVDIVLVAYSSLPDQEACAADPELTARELQVNAVSVVTLLTGIAARMEAQGHGTIAAISSVAGDRGRQSNYIYGAAKAMVTVALQGLRNRLAGKGVHVLTIKPGFVDTPMTARFERKGMLWADPERVAAGIVRAIERRKDVAYLPWFWRPIMFFIRGVPERLFKRLSL